ncbi:protein NRT1/ PTR FAMILY 5.4-like [Pyrus x bretschneideri]|uniref:protein NRT1/ PTR FAMILY 5.4-like n=1 Tax=Pyrus x bretschneideri TaxID=225117 RepID=UPI002030AEA4|nr:protein NRT1/ PTR FAMILY 5.4-like [Pyrus x bretschneideri]
MNMVEVAQQFAFYGLASNLIMYLTNVLDQPLAAAAKNVTTWLGVSSVFPVLGAFLADSYFGRFKTIVFSVAIYFLGTVLLTLSVSVIPSQRRRAVFFAALYILSVAQGGQQPCLQTFAADQFDENTPEEIKAKSSFFNWWYLGFVFAATSATLGVVYLQDNVGWGLGFGILAGVLLVSLVSFLLGTKRYRKQRPPGSPFTTVAQVLVAAARKWHVTETLNCENVCYGDEKGEGQLQGQSQPVVLARTNQLRCLDKAMIIDELDASTEPRNPWRLCSLNQVEEVKLVLRLIPLWLSCLMFGVIQVQHNTFFTKQSSTTILSIGPHFKVPPASLQGLSGIAILITIPIYDRVFVPIARKYTGHPSGITVLQRIGTGLVLSILVMVVSALVEAKRLNIAKDYNLIDKPKAIVPMRVWWLLPQYLILGLAYAFATVGLQELFYHQMPEQMRSMGAAALYCVMGVGSFMSNWIISAVQLITSRNGDKWLGDNINRAHLDYFYWVLAVLSTLNFCVYVLIANAFVYKKVKREDKVETELSIANNHGGEIGDILIGHDSSAQEEQDSNMDKVIYH